MSLKTMEDAKKPSYKYCLVPQCTNTMKTTPDKVFFNIPRVANVREQWCKIMRRDNVSAISCLHCCEDHFDIKEDTANYVQYNIMKQHGVKVKLRLKKGVVPHIFMCQKRSMPQPDERPGAIKRKKIALVNEALSELAIKISNVSEIGEPPQTIHNTSVCKTRPSISSNEVCDDHQAVPSTSHLEGKLLRDKAVQVNIKLKYRSKGVNVNLVTEKKNIELSPLLLSHNIGTSPIKRELDANPLADKTSVSSSVISTDNKVHSLSELKSVKDNSEEETHVMRSGMLTAVEKETKMLIGLPKQSYHLIKILSNKIPLPVLHILITLKKIKLNESFSILALNFGYAQSTISSIFSTSIPLIAAQMEDLIMWPTESDICKKLPISFRSRFAHVVSIIDCLEIQIEKPSNAIHQSLTWSQDKKCNTLKYLISCTPDGLVNFISDGYGGRATDVMIVRDCDFLQVLPPNKAVMVGKGFKDLSYLLQAKKCTLIRLPSVSDSTLSSKDEVKQSKQIAALQTHVDRVINRLREFHMLLPHACVEHNLIPIIDQVIIVACGLVNMQEN